MHVQANLLTQADSKELDNELLSNGFGYKLEQLVEIAGFNCSSCILHCINHRLLNDCAIHSISDSSSSRPIIVFCGPGNNGGDGLVIARYLKLFGGFPIVICPKVGKHHFFNNLVLLLKSFDVPIYEKIEDARSISNSALFIDALFGFGYNNNKTDPCFSEILGLMINAAKLNIPIISIDVPSGWEVDMKKNSNEYRIMPQILISLTAPKLCSKYFDGTHFIASLFATREIMCKYKVEYVYDLFLRQNATQFILLHQKDSLSTVF